MAHECDTITYFIIALLLLHKKNLKLYYFIISYVVAETLTMQSNWDVSSLCF